MALIRAVLLAVTLSACATSAREPSAASALAPLIGCWNGAFEGNAAIHDERCFERNGEAVRDTHFVRPTSYSGESTYAFDSAEHALVFTYRASDGGSERGVFHVDGNVLVFDPNTYVGGDGQTLRLRSRWVIESADRYVATTEVEQGGVWRPWGRVTYTRTR